MSAHFLRLPTALLVTLVLAGCATVPEASRDRRDPLESVNRSVYAFNDGIDKAVLRPVARGYKKVVPTPVQTGVSNFFANAKYPVTLVNNLLQGKFTAALSDTARFTLNTTFGLGGLLDPATAAGLDVNDEDFGQTLGKWGVPPGPYLVLPLLGPYTVRDGIGSLADDFAEPRAYLEDDSTRWELWAADKFERRVRLLEADAVLDRAGDPYTFVRSAYLQRREYLVRDGDVPAEDLELEMELEPEEDDDAVTPGPAPKPDAVKPDAINSAAAASPLR
ncbi:MAG: VacJ family lipoprotein [Gammaproteobacteria bacterium]